MPAFMMEHRQNINMDNFQTGKPAGDISLLLVVEELSLHPKKIIQFHNGPVRQKTPNNKFLILTGNYQDSLSLHFLLLKLTQTLSTMAKQYTFSTIKQCISITALTRNMKTLRKLRKLKNKLMRKNKQIMLKGPSKTHA